MDDFITEVDRSLESTSLLVRAHFDTHALVSEFLPKLRDANKRLVHAISCPQGVKQQGTLVVARWSAMALNQQISRAKGPKQTMRQDIYQYEPPGGLSVDWYVNFADYNLFVAYGGPLFAQDEMQVAEHPALASIREAMLAQPTTSMLQPRTRDARGPTPVLIRGVERRCAVATDRDVDQDRPYGLYGNAFSRGSERAIRAATRTLVPPSVSNILAMEAPAGGRGAYSRAEIEDVLVTAHTGFVAAGIESRLATPNAHVVVHTGNWGTGAYGGNKVLMALLQMYAANLANLDELIYHTVDQSGSSAYREAEHLMQRRLAPALDESTNQFIDAIVEMGFQWGTSDGN